MKIRLLKFILLDFSVMTGQTLLLILNTNFVAAAERGLQCDYSLFMAYVNRASDDKASIAVSRTAEWI